MDRKLIREGDMFSDINGSYMIFDMCGQHTYPDCGDYCFTDNLGLWSSVGEDMSFLVDDLGWKYEGNLLEEGGKPCIKTIIKI